MATLAEFLFGSDFKKMSTMTKDQKKILGQLLGQLSPEGATGQAYGQAMQNMMGLLDPSPEAFEQFAAPYRTEFEEKTIPGLAEKFAGAGGGMGGALSSSGFGQALGGAGAQLESNLASLKGGLMQQAMQGIMGQYGSMLGTGLGAQSFGYASPQQGFLPQLALNAAQAAPYMMGGM